MKRSSGETGKAEMSANTPFSSKFMRPYVSTALLPLALSDDLYMRADTFRCSCVLYLSFRRARNKYFGKWYVLFTDDSEAAVVLGARAKRFRDYEDLMAEAAQNPPLALMLKYCHIDEHAFTRAIENYGVRFPYSFRYEEYERDCGGHTRYITAGEKDVMFGQQKSHADEIALRRAVVRGKNPMTLQKEEEDD